MIGPIKPVAKSSSSSTLKEVGPACSFTNGKVGEGVDTGDDENETSQAQQTMPSHCRMHCCHSHGPQAIRLTDCNGKHSTVNIPIEMGEFCAMGHVDVSQMWNGWPLFPYTPIDVYSFRYMCCVAELCISDELCMRSNLAASSPLTTSH